MIFWYHFRIEDHTFFGFSFQKYDIQMCNLCNLEKSNLEIIKLIDLDFYQTKTFLTTQKLPASCCLSVLFMLFIARTKYSIFPRWVEKIPFHIQNNFHNLNMVRKWLTAIQVASLSNCVSFIVFYKYAFMCKTYVFLGTSFR